MTFNPETAPTGALRARLGSCVALVALLALLGYGVRAGYRLATDSFVAPIVLSPESDIVITSSLRLGELQAERAKMSAERERIDAELSASGHAIEQLEALAKVAEGGLAWSSALSLEAGRASQRDLHELSERERSLHEMQQKQAAFVLEMEKSLAAGLVAKADYVREVLALSQLRLAAVDTERARLATSLQLKQAQLARAALTARPGQAAALLTPEMLAQRSQSVHIELELLKLEAERRSLAAKKSVADQEIAQIDQMTTQMRRRPVYRAVTEQLEVAFVPYTQLEGVAPGASVHACFWGLFACEPVGVVSELLEGEVVMPDPWGAQARGLYAVLQLTDREASRAKVLRIRSAAHESAQGALSSTTP